MNHLIDTNVLLAATAHAAPDERKITPPGKNEREAVFLWLDAFVQGNEVWVVDGPGKIIEEYHNKQTHQDFSMLALLDKQSRNHVLEVDVVYDGDGFAVLPAHLDGVKWDKSDKKFVAAGLQIVMYGDPVQIVNAADTDWYDVKNTLADENIGLLQLIDAWCRNKYREKYDREPPG